MKNVSNSSISDQNEFLDSYLTHVCHEISNSAKDLVQMAINLRCVTGKQQVQDYEQRFYDSLDVFFEENGHFSILFSTFTSLVGNDILKAFNSINGFFPIVFGSPPIKDESMKSILNFFPSIFSGTNDVGLVIGYINESIFSEFANSLLSIMSTVSDPIATIVLQRVFDLTLPSTYGAIELGVVRLSIKKHNRLISKVSKMNFKLFSSFFCQLFPTKQTNAQSALLFFDAIHGIRASETSFPLISTHFLQIPKLYSTLISNEIKDSICQSLHKILPHMKSIVDSSFLNKVEDSVKKSLKSPMTWKSSLKLIGVIHYLQLPNISSSSYVKFLSRYVYKRFLKPEKISGALEYFCSALKPLDDLGFNWCPQTNSFIREIWNKVFIVSSIECHDQTSKLLEYIAALDFSTFVNDWLPTILNPQSAYVNVALITVQRVLNPLSGFMELAKTVPANASTGFQKLQQNVISLVSVFVQNHFLKKPLPCTNLILSTPSISKVLSSLYISEALEKSNNLSIPATILYYLLKWRSFNPIMPTRSKNKIIIDNSTRSCEGLLKQWIGGFDTLHQSYGDILSTEEYKFIEFSEMKISIDLAVVPMIPLLIAFTNNLKDFTYSLLHLMSSLDPYVSALSAVMYQALFLSFPKDSYELLVILGNHIKHITTKSIGQMHSLFETYSHCLTLSLNQIKDNVHEIILLSDFVSFCSLCSPFPETHLVSYDILDTTAILKQHCINGPINSLYNIINEKASAIELKMVVTILSEYSTWNESTCPVHKVPSISFKMAAFSRYPLLWRFALVELSSELVHSPLIELVLTLQTAFLDASSIVQYPTFYILDCFDLSFFTNVFAFLLSSPSSPPSSTSIQSRKNWIKNSESITGFLNIAAHSVIRLKKSMLCVFSFVFSSIHIGSLSNAISSFLSLLSSPDIKLGKKEGSLAVFATMLRHFAMHTSFDDYIVKMISSGQIFEIFSIFDSTLQIFMQLEGESHFSHLFHSMEVLSHFLIFRGQYYRYIHQSRLDTPHSPIPRCAVTRFIEDKEISPRYTKEDIFLLFFKWSKIGIEDSVIPGLQESISKEPNPPDNKQITGFGHASRVVLSYLSSLGTIFSNKERFTQQFLNDCCSIGSMRPSFLKHLLSNHMKHLLVPFSQMALSSQIDNATLFVNAITSVFVPPTTKDSMIHSHNTFLKNISTSPVLAISETDSNFVKLVYMETGTLLLVGLFFIMHNDLTIRQNAIRMIGQVFPAICLIHYCGDQTIAKSLMKTISRSINEISTQNSSLRIDSVVELSSECSQVFSFATEQILFRAFSAVTSAWLNRRYCSKEQLLLIITPWFSNILFDLKSRIILKESSKFFVYFSPFLFMVELCSCLNQFCNASESIKTRVLKIFESITIRSSSPEGNTKFIIISLIEISISQPELKHFTRFCLSYLYRLYPKTIKILVPLLHFGNWYFYHVQLGTFEEISDMDAFLNDVNHGQTSLPSVCFSKSQGIYHDSTQFALESLKELAQEDIMPFIPEFCSIVSYCLTHINQKSAFDLLYTLVEGLNSSFDSGSPEVLWNTVELLSRINSVQYDVIRFVNTDDDPPLRSLQKRIVSVSGLLSMFLQIFSLLPMDQEDPISSYLLLWGLSCGDLKIASTALNLYSSSFDTIEPRVIFHLIESGCIVLRCLSTSECDNECFKRSSIYIESVLRALKSILKSLIASGQLTSYPILFWFPIAILGFSGPLLAVIVEELMLFLIHIIQSGVFDPKSREKFDQKAFFDFPKNWGCEFVDFQNSINYIMKYSNNAKVLCSFLMSIIRIPANILSINGDYSIYLLAFSPFLCMYVESPRLFSQICKFSEFSDSLSRLSLLFPKSQISSLLNQLKAGEVTNPQVFSYELIHSLSQNVDSSIFVTASMFYNSMLRLSPGISVNALFDLCSALISISSTKEILNNLAKITREATVNQELGEFSNRIRFLQTISSHSNQENLPTLEHGGCDTEPFSKEWDSAFQYLQTQVKASLHSAYSSSPEQQRVRFDSFQTFPPIFPFEEDFLKCKCIEEVANFCRQVQVDPQTNWAYSLYCAQDFTDQKALPDESPPMNLEIHFESILASILETLEESPKEEVQKKNHQAAIEPATKKSSSSNTALFLIAKIEFLPSSEYCEAITSEYLKSIQ